MEEQKSYTTHEEMEELKNWFEIHVENLPESLQIDTSIFTPDLKKTIRMLLEQALVCHKNPKMQGSIILLKKIQQKCQKV